MKKCLMFSLPVSICVWSLVIVALSHNASAADSDRTYFTNPPSSTDADGMPDYELGSVQEISWTTDLDIFNISIWQRDQDSGNKSNGGNIFAKINPSETINTFSWAVQTYSLDLNDSSIFFLAIEAGSHSWTSANFIITSSTKSSPSSSTTPISDSDSPTTTDSPTSLTSTGKIALGLGAGIGAPLICLLAILAYFQYRSARRAYTHTQALQNHPDHHHPHHHSHSQQPPPAWRHPSASPTMDQLTVPPSILPPKQVPMSVPLYRNRSLPPSELPQKLARPVYEPPWEVHSDSAVGHAHAQAQAPVGLGVGVGVGNWSEHTTRTGYGRDSRGGTGNTSVRSSAGLGIPELPGEGSNFI
ncbi:hypothetical protein ASPVEDRAFT_210508 [Aspergillus versicolor CBS 583.65]|uniref:Mid2 domain-containing protein n=1 Tax=Aspergillus versicolor CBS 583.65 TaxID=1036611 RepID=A0A1L9P342_ASPVE|nr:uncharacterized protein ASPVEDRAFT_210508 [Aspergillus versicolor CBS 583.65]OJI95945.1 hypothetical protein ASPVEDRAFT_210508 [Aspergillus versicolor CBS 583.65]